MLTDREILARTYEDKIGQSPLWTGFILNGPQHGHTSWIDVELAVEAMQRLRLILADKGHRE